MADRYWVGGAGVWNATAGTKWATTSGGAGGAAVPTVNDRVFFDAASGAVAVTSDASVFAQSIDFTGFTGSYAAGGGITVTIGDASGGALKVVSGMSGFSAGSTTTTLLFLSSATNGGIGWDVDLAGKLWQGNITFNNATGKWLVKNDISGLNTITLNAGHLDTNSKNITANAFTSSSGLTRVLTLGSSVIDVQSLVMTSCVNMTTNAGTSKFIVRNANQNYMNTSGPNQAFYDLTVDMSGSGSASNISLGNITVAAKPTFNTVTFIQNRVSDIFRHNASNFSCNSLVVQGTKDAPVMMCSGTHGLPVNIDAASVTLSDVIMMDINAGGAAAPWTGTRLQDGQGNSNITFPAGQTNYWVPATPRLTGSAFYTGSNPKVINYASVPDSVPLSITGDIEIQAKFEAITYVNGAAFYPVDGTALGNQAILCKGNVPGVATRSYMVAITASTQQLVFYGSTDGSTQFSATSTVGLRNPATGTTLLPGDPIWIKVTRVAATGVVTFYVSNDGSSWTQLGNTVAATSGNLFNSPHSLYIGAGEQAISSPFKGDIYKIKILNGIAGTTVFDANFDTATANASSFTESSANAATVTMNLTGSETIGSMSDVQHWATSSGGTSGTGRMPYAHDDIRVDANSGTSPVLLSDKPWHGRNIDFTGSITGTYCPAPAANNTLCSSIVNFQWGSLTMPSNSQILGGGSGASGFAYIFAGRGNISINTNGMSWFVWPNGLPSYVILNFSNPGGTTTISPDFITQQPVTWGWSSAGVTSGSTNLTFSGNASMFSFSDLHTSNIRTLNWGTGSITLSQLSPGSTGAFALPNQNQLQMIGNPTFIIPEMIDGRIVGGAYTVPRWMYRQNSGAANNAFFTDPIAGMTGDLEIIMRVNMSDWTPIGYINLFGTGPISGGTPVQWELGVGANGSLTLNISTNGTSYTQPTSSVAPFVDGTTYWIKVNRTSSTGTVQFYYAADQSTIPSSWTQIGSNVAGATGALNEARRPLFVGNIGTGNTNNLHGVSVYHAQVATSAGGSPVATANFSAQQDNIISFQDPQGNEWKNFQATMVAVGRIIGDSLYCPPQASTCSAISGHSTALQPTNEFEIVCRVSIADWTPSATRNIVNKGQTSGALDTYALRVDTLGRLVLNSGNGTTSFQVNSVATGFVDGTTYWVKATWRNSDGRIQFFYAADQVNEPSSWTQLGTDQFAGVGAVPTVQSTFPLEIAGYANLGGMDGNMKRLIFKKSIGGAADFDVDFTGRQDDTYAIQESSANGAYVYVSTLASPAGSRPQMSWSQIGRQVPGTLNVQGGGGRAIAFTSSPSALHFHPRTSITDGKWVLGIDSTAGIRYFPDLNITTTGDKGRNAFLSQNATISTTFNHHPYFADAYGNNYFLMNGTVNSDNIALPGAANNMLFTHSNPAWTPTGNFGIAMRVMMTDWTPASSVMLLAKEAIAGIYSYALYVNATTGRLTFRVSLDGTTTSSATSTVSPTISDGQYLWIYVTREASTGDVKFYTAADQASIPSSWTQLGTTQSTTAGAPFASNSIIEFGSNLVGQTNTLNGQIKRVIMYNGIPGSIIADFDASTAKLGGVNVNMADIRRHTAGGAYTIPFVDYDGFQADNVVNWSFMASWLPKIILM